MGATLHPFDIGRKGNPAEGLGMNYPRSFNALRLFRDGMRAAIKL
jgi:hypothetical protein